MTTTRLGAQIGNPQFLKKVAPCQVAVWAEFQKDLVEPMFDENMQRHDKCEGVRNQRQTPHEFFADCGGGGSFADWEWWAGKIPQTARTGLRMSAWRIFQTFHPFDRDFFSQFSGAGKTILKVVPRPRAVWYSSSPP